MPQAQPSPADPKRALLLVNRRARRGSESIDAALAVLRQAGFELVEPSPSDERSCADKIRAYADGIGLAIIGGGDGTLNNAAPGLLDTGMTMGILPLGTANDLARTLGIPADPVAAARIVIAGVTRRLDVGEVNGHPYFNVASVGFSATLARNLTSDAKKRFGILGYAVAALKLLSESRPFTVEIDHDGRTERARTIQVSVGSGRFYGGGMTVEENATPDDGRLNVYSLEVGHWIELIKLLPALRRGTHGRWKNVRAFDTTELSIRTRRPRDINADGELVTTTPAHFRIHTRVLSVCVPTPTSES
jgi:YegS/Rv2252/BmrU family lipid kinase